MRTTTTERITNRPEGHQPEKWSETNAEASDGTVNTRSPDLALPSTVQRAGAGTCYPGLSMAWAAARKLSSIRRMVRSAHRLDRADSSEVRNSFTVELAPLHGS